MKIDGKEWRLVPVEATAEMQVEATEQWLCKSAMEDRSATIYDAMLAACPTPDIEALVEGVAKVIRPDVFLFGTTPQLQENAMNIARAVLRHLFGEG